MGVSGYGDFDAFYYLIDINLESPGYCTFAQTSLALDNQNNPSGISTEIYRLYDDGTIENRGTVVS